MGTKSDKSSDKSHPAVDSNTAAKKSKLVKIDNFMVGVLNSLLSERETFLQRAREAQFKIDNYLKQCAETKGLNADEWMFDDQKAGFVIKPAPKPDKKPQ